MKLDVASEREIIKFPVLSHSLLKDTLASKHPTNVLNLFLYERSNNVTCVDV